MSSQELESHLNQLGDNKETHPISEHSLKAVRNYYYYLEDEINIIKKTIVEFQRQVCMKFNMIMTILLNKRIN